MKQDKLKSVEKLIISLTDSLLSHLPWIYSKNKKTAKFHKDCIKQYAIDIVSASKLL